MAEAEVAAKARDAASLRTRWLRQAAESEVCGPKPIADISAALQLRHRAVSAAFSARPNGEGEASAPAVADAPSGGRSEHGPLLVTFEDMARGLHFDAVDTVFIVGLPDSPAAYVHLAGRTCRQPVLEGSVITICPGRSHEQLLGWRTRLGGISIRPLLRPDSGGEAEGDGEAEGRKRSIATGL